MTDAHSEMSSEDRAAIRLEQLARARMKAAEIRILSKAEKRSTTNITVEPIVSVSAPTESAPIPVVKPKRAYVKRKKPDTVIEDKPESTTADSVTSTTVDGPSKPPRKPRATKAAKLDKATEPTPVPTEVSPSNGSTVKDMDPPLPLAPKPRAQKRKQTVKAEQRIPQRSPSPPTPEATPVAVTKKPRRVTATRVNDATATYQPTPPQFPTPPPFVRGSDGNYYIIRE
jgi:hypothetical protein